MKKYIYIQVTEAKENFFSLFFWNSICKSYSQNTRKQLTKAAKLHKDKDKIVFSKQKIKSSTFFLFYLFTPFHKRTKKKYIGENAQHTSI